MPNLLRPDSRQRTGESSGPESPEALFISAMIEEGVFDPERWRIDDEDLACWEPLWKFCRDHQLRAGRAPTASLLERTFPDFEITRDVDPVWAATKLREASASRKLRERMQEALQQLAEDDLEGAYQALDGYMVPVNTRREALSSFELDVDESEIDETALSAPWDILGRATGGIHAGEMWLIGARLGQGKTNMGAGPYCASMLKDGAKGIYFSLEMPAHQISKKVNRALAAYDKDLLAKLDSEQKLVRQEGLAILKERVPGLLRVYDPSHGPVDVRAVRDAMAEADFVMVDHVGLMRLGNKLAISDWRIAAEISNRLKEETLRTSSRLLGLIQINRAGDTSSPERTPKTSELSQTDAWGQDSDVVVTMNRFSTSVMVHSTEKVRNGPQVRWYTEFDPARARYRQISRDQAQGMAVNDEDAAERARH